MDMEGAALKIMGVGLCSPRLRILQPPLVGSAKGVDEGQERVHVSLLRWVLDGLGRVLGKEEDRGEANQAELLGKGPLVAVCPELADLYSRTLELLGYPREGLLHPLHADGDGTGSGREGNKRTVGAEAAETEVQIFTWQKRHQGA